VAPQLPSDEDEYGDPSQAKTLLTRRKGRTCLTVAGDVRLAVLYSTLALRPKILRDLVRRGAACTVMPRNYSTISRRSAIDRLNGLFVQWAPTKRGGVDYTDMAGEAVSARLQKN
jgi:hypothetical protein